MYFISMICLFKFNLSAMKINTLLFLKINFLLALILSTLLLCIDFRECENEENETGALESMQWISRIRAYPNNDVPQENFYSAFEYSRKNLADKFAGKTSSVWQCIGPYNEGGRSLCLAVHPVDTSVLYIGSSSGGLWKSTTGGVGASAWTQVNTGFPSLAVSSIAIDSANPSVIYIGTGENYGYQYSLNGLDVRVTRGMYGIGILKTTDGGVTWTKSLDWSYNNRTGIWKVLINPQNHNILYAATSEGIYKSTDAGGNWASVLGYKMVIDLLINPVNPSVLYASIGNLTNNAPTPLAERGIFKSTDAGVSWTKLSGGLPSTWSGKANIDMYKGNPDVIVASICNDVTTYVGLYRTTNAGANWTVGSTSVASSNQGWYNNGVIIKPNDQNTILVGTLNVEKSTNFGSSFSTNSSWSAWYSGATPPGQPEGPSNYVHADVHNFTSNPLDPNKVYVLTDGGLYRSNTFGGTNSFYSCNGGYVSTQFYATLGNSYQDSNYCMGGLQDNRSAFYQGNPAWYKTSGGDGFCSAVNANNDNIVYTSYTYGDIERSVNRGVSFSYTGPSTTGDSNYFCFAAPFIVCKSDPQIVYLGSKGVYKATDGGAGTWSSLYGSSQITTKILSMAASYYSTDTLYVGALPTGGSAKIFRSVNGGLNYTDITGSIVPNAYPTGMTINPSNSMQVYVTFGGFGNAHVIRSTDGGASWINITSNLPDVPHHTIIIDPLYTNNIYVGNDLGVYASTDNGATWGEFRTGMPYALVFDLSISYPSRNLRAATHGNGVWQAKLMQYPTAVQIESNKIPATYSLEQNYPNPFNPATTIKFALPKNDFISIKIYDVSGKLVKTLIDEQKSAGYYSVNFDASLLSSGLYFYSISSPSFTESKKMIVVK
jgi:photosystem II stability/assembly factor-like uncharacterized protein